MSPTITPDYSLVSYDVGVFKQDPTNCVKVDENGVVYENLDRTEEIIAGLQRIGFSATEVPLSSDVVYEKFDVLYMPYGWACTKEKYDFQKVLSFLDYPSGKGLLIGNPVPPNKWYELELFPNFTFSYNPLSRDIVQALPTPIYYAELTDDLSPIENILGYLEPIHFPVSESVLMINEVEDMSAKYTYRLVLRNPEPFYGPCLVTSYKNPKFYNNMSVEPRWVALPGSEYSVGKRPISAELMRDIILWLARAK